MNEMKLTSIELSRLKPLERNVRKHSDKQIEELVRSVQQFGQTRAIVTDEEYNILIGNGLYFALQKMGANEAQCFIKKGLTEIQKKKLVLADNQIYKLGIDNYDEIKSYINDITITGDFEIAGYDKYVLETMTMSDEESEEALNSYGIIPDQKLTETKEEHKQTAPETPQYENKTVIVTEQEVSAPVARKHVVCPSCGEVIYLD